MFNFNYLYPLYRIYHIYRIYHLYPLYPLYHTFSYTALFSNTACSAPRRVR